MTVQLTSTTKVVELNGVPARIWEGFTDSGVPVHAYITRIAHDRSAPQFVVDKFTSELQECKAPSAEIATIPLRLIL